MDKKIIDELGNANGAAIALITMMINDDGSADYTELIEQDRAYRRPTTCVALGSIAYAAINAVSVFTEIPPEQVVQELGLQAALLHIKLLNEHGE